MARPHPLLLELAAGRPFDPRRVDMSVVESAVEHRMAGLLLATVDPSKLAGDVRMRLEAVDMAADVHRRRLKETAAVLHGAFDDADLDHLFFKGIVEAHRVFPHPRQRPFADVDVALHPSVKLSAATEAVAPDHPWLAHLDDLAAKGHLTAVSFYLDGIPVDIHTDPVKIGPGLRRPDLWWEHTAFIEIPDVGRVRAFDRDASLAAFLLHQARDRFRYLIGGAEFRLRLEQPIDWSRVRRLAEAEGVWEQVATATEALSEMIGIRSPVVAPGGARTRVWRAMWNPDIRLGGPGSRMRYTRRGVWLMPLLARGRFLGSGRWIARSMAPPDAYLRLKHPRARGPYWSRVVTSRVTHIGRRRVTTARNWWRGRARHRKG